MAEFIIGDTVKPSFRRDLVNVINRHNREGNSNTPDFVLAEYLLGCLEAFDRATVARESWHGLKGDAPGAVRGDDDRG